MFSEARMPKTNEGTERHFSAYLVNPKKRQYVSAKHIYAGEFVFLKYSEVRDFLEIREELL